MYQIGDLIMYGDTGVCRIENILNAKEVPTLRGVSVSCEYYVLQSFYQSEIIYTPVGNPKVFMRKIISQDKAEALIALIPSMTAEIYHSTRMQELKEHYELAIRTHDCKDLIELTMSIYAKKQDAEQQNRKLGQLDERYMKRAEELLYGEFAVALGIPKEEVSAYISKKVSLL